MKGISILILAVFLGAFMADGAAAALSAPNWMPGSPILAGNQVILLWAPVPGAVKYNIYMNGKKLQDSVSIQAIVAAPDAAGTYEFQVAGVDAANVEGAKTSPGIVKIFKLTAPKNLEGRAVGKSVALHWDAVGGAVLYNVYRSTQSGTGYVLAESIQDIRWTDSKTEVGKKYFYRVTAKDASGKESAQSPEFMVSTEATASAGPAAIKNVMGRKTKFIAALTDKDFTAQGIIKIFEPYDIAYSPDRTKVYFSSVNTRTVIIMDAEGNYLKKFGDGDKTQPGNFSNPYGIGIARDGRIYVADFAENTVQIFSADGVFEKVFATVVKTDWMKNNPSLSDVDIDEAGNVYVLEYANGAVIKYDPSGKEISHFSKQGPDAENQTGYPTFIKVIGGKIYIADGARGRVMVTDQAGKVLQRIGKKGVGVGMLQGMGGFDIDENGMVYIVDRVLSLIQVYDMKTGSYQYTLANEDNTTPMPVQAPKAVAVDGKKQRLWVAQGIINQVRLFEMFGKAEEAKGK